MSGINTSWGAQEQNERIISALAWMIVVIMLFYAFVFVYKKLSSPPVEPVTRVPVTAVPTPTATAKPTVFAVSPTPTPTPRPTERPTERPTPRVTTRPTPRATVPTVPPTPTATPTPTPSPRPTFVVSTPPTPPTVPPTVAPTVAPPPTPRATLAVVPPTVAVPTPPTPSLAPVPTLRQPDERRFTIRVGSFPDVETAMQRAPTLRELQSLAFEPRIDRDTGLVSLYVGKFSSPRDAQVALAAIRANHPGLPATVIPLVPSDSTQPPTVRPTTRPTVRPTVSPTVSPTVRPTVPPTVRPTPQATVRPPTTPPTVRPATRRPTQRPTRVVPATPVPPTVEAGDGDDGGPRPGPGFSVQVGSFSQQANAVNFRRVLERAGFKSYVLEARAGGRDWYRVQLGTFTTGAEAEPTLKQFERMYNMPAIVVRRP